MTTARTNATQLLIVALSHLTLALATSMRANQIPLATTMMMPQHELLARAPNIGCRRELWQVCFRERELQDDVAAGV